MNVRMVYQTHHISASLVNTSTAEIPFSKGIIDQQLDDCTYIIRTSSGDVTVRVPKNSLEVDEPVSITFRGDSVLIDRLDSNAETYEKLEDLIELRLGAKIGELLAILKDLKNSLSDELVDPALLHQLDSTIRMLEKKVVDIASLIEIINRIKSEVGPQLIRVNKNLAEKALAQVSKVLSYCTEKEYITGAESCSASQSNVIKLFSSPEQGFWYVRNTNEAMELLLKHTGKMDTDLEGRLKPFFGRPLFIRFFESVSGIKKAFFMTPEQAKIEAEHFLRSEMKSCLMKRLNPSLITDAAIQRGKLVLSQLCAIDNLIASISTKDSSPFIKEDARNITWSQLLAAVFDRGDNKLPGFQTALTHVGSRIPALVGDIVDFFNRSDDDFKLVDLKRIVPESMSLLNSDKRSDFLHSVFKNMGYSLEHELYQVSQGQNFGILKDSPSLKLALLLILGYLNTLAEDKSFMVKDGAEETLVKNIFSREIHSATSKATGSFAQEVAQSGGDSTLERISVEMIRQQVETILNHLENLQMLAKPTTGADGDQQVLVLPVNMGDEWTELRIRFVKERHGKSRRKEPKHVSVTLNIDLKSLGEVTARMEYEIKKSLDISLTFDNEQAKEWFQKNRKDLIEALTGMGFKAIKVGIRNKNIEKKRKTISLQKTKEQRAGFDVRG